MPSQTQAQAIDSRRLVGIKAERVTNVSSTDFPGHYPGEDHSWNLKRFQKNLQVKIQRLSQRSVEFDIVGVDASIANAFRRIMIAEVPTICIEHVFVWLNTTVIQDEVLASRIGLVPLNVDPALMLMRGPNDNPTDQNTLVFNINLTCERKVPPKGGAPAVASGSGSSSSGARSSASAFHAAHPSVPNPSELYTNHELLSSHLTWVPAGSQEEVFATNLPAPTNGNIVLAKMRPGQEVEIEMHAVKGVGKDHAKFSPVATASYRLLPNIKILKPIPAPLAEKFQKCFSPGVINVDPRTKAVSVDADGVRKDLVSREVLRHPEFEGYVELGRVRDHFLFSVESEGPYAPERLLPEAVKVMREKLAIIKAAAEALRERAISGSGIASDGNADVVMDET